MEEKIKSIKARSCEFVSNLSSIAEKLNCPEDEAFKTITDKLDSLKYVTHWAGIIHDSDYDDDGNKKDKHCHIVIAFSYGKSYSGVSKDIGMPDSTLEKIHFKKPFGNKMVADIGGALSYLTHRNDESKYQYQDDLVVSSTDWDWKSERDISEKRVAKSELDTIYQKILSGEITDSNLSNHIDPYIYSKNKKTINNMFDYRYKTLKTQHDRDMTVIYIFGHSGSGKTTLAKKFCENKNISYFITGGKNDPFEGYADEKAIILDDVRSNAFSPEEWLKILDPYTISAVRSRYHNKIIIPEFMILTSIHPPTVFFNFSNEDPIQFKRRITLYMEIKSQTVDVYIYDEHTDEFEYFKEIENPIKQIIRPKKSVDELSTIISGFENKTKLKNDTTANDIVEVKNVTE